VARRYRVREDEIEDLLGAMRLKLVDNDYEVLRRYEGRANLATYLSVIVTSHLLDERNARWGKWRPSVYAKRLGPAVMHLEMLITRDGMPFEEATRILRATMNVVENDAELQRISLGFRSRPSRRFVEPDALEQVPAVGAFDDQIERDRRANLSVRIEAALGSALAKLSDQDQLLLRLCFEQQQKLSDIARSLQTQQKPLYRQRERVLATLRRALELEGIGPEDIREIAGSDIEPPRVWGNGNSDVASV
jgi:RNA polymerase sigma factor (sigma-70 family)